MCTKFMRKRVNTFYFFLQIFWLERAERKTVLFMFGRGSYFVLMHFLFANLLLFI